MHSVTFVVNTLQRACQAYFGMKLRVQDKPWAPHKVCKNCNVTLYLWTKGSEISEVQGAYGLKKDPEPSQ